MEWSVQVVLFCTSEMQVVTSRISKRYIEAIKLEYETTAMIIINLK
ncbi:MAG: hypothetical protein ACTS6G_05770 [Candidatus Hodgkinia cicadicola]